MSISCSKYLYETMKDLSLGSIHVCVSPLKHIHDFHVLKSPIQSLEARADLEGAEAAHAPPP